MRRMDAPGARRRGWSEQTGCLRVEPQIPLSPEENMKKVLSLFFIAFVCIGCGSTGKQQYKGSSFFTSDIDLSTPVEDRIQTASADVISWLVAFDMGDTYRPYMPTMNEKRLFAEYVQLLPEAYRRVMREKVIAIFFIDDFEGGGMTMPDFDKKGNMFLILFFNPEILRRSLSEWINIRENSYFNDNAGIDLIIECGGDYYALIHTLMHEASHIYDYYNHVTPFTEPELREKRSPAKTGFTDAVWENHGQPLMSYDFPYREELYAWGLGPVQRKVLAMDIYRSLSQTPFASLYGSQNWAEDFAEHSTWYFLEKDLNITYRVRVIKNPGLGNEENFVYEPLSYPLVRERFSILAAIK